MNNSVNGRLDRYVDAYRTRTLGKPVEEKRYPDQGKLDREIALEKGLYYHYDRLDNTREDRAPADDVVLTESPLYGLKNSARLDSPTNPVTGAPAEGPNLWERIHHNDSETHLNAYHFSGQQIDSLEITARGKNGAIVEERRLVAGDPAASVYRRWHL